MAATQLGQPDTATQSSNARSSYHRTSYHHHINAHHPSAVTQQSLESYVQGYTYLHTYTYTYLCRHVWLCTVLAQRGPSAHDTVSGTTTHRNVNKYSVVEADGSTHSVHAPQM